MKRSPSIAQRNRGTRATADWGVHELHVRLASADDLDALFRARHRAYAESDKYFRTTPDGRISDRYDHLATTRQLLAEDNGHVVGGARLTSFSALGLPAFDYFDFWPYLPRDVVRFGSGSMLFVDPSFRRRDLGQALMAHWYAQVLALGWTHALGVLNPPISRWLTGHGWNRVAGELVDAQGGLPFVPVVLDLAQLRPDVLAEARLLQTYAFGPEAVEEEGA